MAENEELAMVGLSPLDRLPGVRERRAHVQWDVGRADQDGTWQEPFRFDRPMPYDPIERIARLRVKQNVAKTAAARPARKAGTKAPKRKVSHPASGARMRTGR